MFIHNISGTEKTYIGTSIQDGEFYQVEESKKVHYGNDELLLVDIMLGNIAISIDGMNDLDNKNAMINYIKGFGINLDNQGYQVVKSNNSAFSSSVLEDGSLLYLKIHGMRKVIGPAILDENNNLIPTEYEFKFTIPYENAFLQGAEIFVDILCQTDMTIDHPLGSVIEQYGFDVCTGKIIYKRQADYASKLPQGLVVNAHVKNTELIEQEFGVNFILHEVRSPSV